MEVRVETIVEVSVRLPDFLEHLDVQAQLIDTKLIGVLFQPGKT